MKPFGSGLPEYGENICGARCVRRNCQLFELALLTLRHDIQTIGIIFFSSLRDFLEKKSIGRTTSVTINTSTELVRKEIILPS